MARGSNDTCEEKGNVHERHKSEAGAGTDLDPVSLERAEEQQKDFLVPPCPHHLTLQSEKKTWLPGTVALGGMAAGRKKARVSIDGKANGK